jgi:hypothetical protein
MDPDRCARGRGTGQKGRKVAGLPARRVRLEPIPKVSLYKIALYCRFIPDVPAAISVEPNSAAPNSLTKAGRSNEVSNFAQTRLDRLG